MKKLNTWNARNVETYSSRANCGIWRSRKRRIWKKSETRRARETYLILIIRFSDLSTQNFLSGGITVVALYSVIMAGPRIRRPGIRSPRSNTGVDSFLLSKKTGACSTGATRGDALRDD